MKIEKDVPLPDTSDAGNPIYSSKYPFAQMEVGDSFEFRLDKMKRVRSAIASFRRRFGSHYRFSVRRTDVKKGRCWRLENYDTDNPPKAAPPRPDKQQQDNEPFDGLVDAIARTVDDS